AGGLPAVCCQSGVPLVALNAYSVWLERTNSVSPATATAELIRLKLSGAFLSVTITRCQRSEPSDSFRATRSTSSRNESGAVGSDRTSPLVIYTVSPETVGGALVLREP